MVRNEPAKTVGEPEDQLILAVFIRARLDLLHAGPKWRRDADAFFRREGMTRNRFRRRGRMLHGQAGQRGAQMASKRRRRRRECTSKRRYETREAAWHALMTLYRTKRVVEQWQVYTCHFCGGYHVGRGQRHLKGRKVKQWMLVG